MEDVNIRREGGIREAVKQAGAEDPSEVEQ